MACASCEERARLLKKAREALNGGDTAEFNRLIKEVFGTVRVDFAKLGALALNMKVGDRVSILKGVEANDPNAEKAKSTGNPPPQLHEEFDKDEPKIVEAG